MENLLDDFKKLMGIDEDIINNDLINKDIEYIKLLYDTKHRFLGYNITSFIASPAIIGLTWNSLKIIAIYVIIVFVISFINMVILNREVNIIRNTYAKKIRLNNDTNKFIKRLNFIKNRNRKYELSNY